MRRITRRLEIDAGHRLLKHESKCKNLHGHRYAFEVTVGAEALDGVGRVIDFGAIKQHLGLWLDDNLDHAFIVQESDPLLDWLILHEQKHFVVPVPPTAENLSELVHSEAVRLLEPLGIVVLNVRCWETPTSYADFSTR